MNIETPLRVRTAEESAASIPTWAYLAAGLVAAVCLFDGLGALGLVGPDDSRYVFIARAMLQSRDWVTPHLYGQPWFEKPVLYYWAAASAFRIWGASEFAARLPSAIGALFATACISWAAWRAYGRTAAWLVFLMLPTTVAAIAFARAASPDMLFSAFLAAATVAGAEMLEKPLPGFTSQIAFGAFLGAATLAKGPAAVILAGGATLLWALASRQWRASLRFFHPMSVASFCLVALPWYVLCTVRNPDFFRVFILEHNFGRYLTPMFHHPQPFWFFGVVILAATVPWTALLIPLALAAYRSRAAGHWRDSPALFFGCWAIFPILFFSFSESKLPGYILPAVPPLVFLFAVNASRYVREPSGDRKSEVRWWVLLVACTFPLLSLLAGYWLRQLPSESGFANPAAMPGLLALSLVGSVGCALFALGGRTRISLVMEAALMSALVWGANTRVLPKLDPYFTARAASREMPAEAAQSDNLSTFELDRSWHYGFNYYLGRELPEWIAGTPRPAWIWTSAEGAAQLDRLGLPYTVEMRVASQAWLLRVRQ